MTHRLQARRAQNRKSGTARSHPVALLLLAAPLLASCVANFYTPHDPAGAEPKSATPSDLAKHLAYPAAPLKVVETPVEDTAPRGFEVSRLSFPSAGQNGQSDNLVELTYYRSVKPGPKNLVVVLPVWGTYTYPTEKISEGVRRRGRGETNVLVLHGEKYIFDWDKLAASPDMHAFRETARTMSDRMRDTAVDVRRIFDWAETQPDVNPDRIALVGFSMSAVISALVLAVDDRPIAGALIMGAANPAEIIANCFGPLGKVRATIRQRFDLTKEAYQASIEDIFDPVNPASYGRFADGERILMIDSHYDECMPGTARDALWESMGRPERISFRFRHRMSFLALTPLGLNYMRSKVYDFLDDRLSAAGANELRAP